MKAHGQIAYLVQGTLYPDVIESVSVKGPRDYQGRTTMWAACRRKMPFALIEPLRDLFKDEVSPNRQGSGLPNELLVKHPFPGQV